MAENTNSLSKYEEISCKVLIHSGSPAVYQLRPKKDTIGTLTKMTFGDRNPNKINKTILLVGETGAGKSTLINALVNYAMGVEWEDEVWFKIVEDEKKSQTESQTSDVIVYEIFGLEDLTLPFSLTIIDTPGYGNTSGIEQDVIVNHRLFDLFRSTEGVHQINVVGLVLKATECRLSDRLSYIFDSLMSLFGKDMERNIVALITHSDGRRPKNALKTLEEANIKCARDEKNQPVYFLFDNCKDEDRSEDTDILENADKVTMKGMTQFKNFLEKTPPQKLEKTLDVLNERITLAACIQNLQERIKWIGFKQTEIQQAQEGLKKYEEEMKKNKDFIIEVDEPYKDVEPIAGRMWGLVFFQGAVCCKICEENCHFPGCTMAWYPEHCEVMRRGRCTSCTRKCPASDHVKENWKFVNKTRKVKKNKEDIKKKYENSKEESVKKVSLLESLQKEMENLEANKTQLLEEAYQHAVKLEQIALKVVSLSTFVHLDFLIEEMEKKGSKDKAEKLRQLSSHKDRWLLAVLKSCYGKLFYKSKKTNKTGTEV